MNRKATRSFVALAFLAVLGCMAAAAPHEGHGTITGFVYLNDKKEPAAGGTVILVDTKMGASIQEDGSFQIEDVPPGTYKIKARLVGYDQDQVPEVTVAAGRKSTVTMTLRQSAVEMNPVVVTGSRRQDASDVRSSVTSITPRDSKILPGAAEDVLRSLQALPGVTSVSDFSSQLIVRGSGPDQNLIMIDGFEVLNPYRLYGVVSMFNPETVSDISLQTGGFAAQYGDRLSSVLDVRTREGRTDVPFGAKINASLTNLNLIAEGALPFNNSSYLLSVRRTYYDLILGPVLKSTKLVAGDVALPNFSDIQAKFSIPLNSTNKLLINGIGSRDGVKLISGVDRDRPDSVNVFDQSYNAMAGLTWQYNPSNNVVVETQASWYRNNGSGAFDGSFVDPSQNTGDLGRADTLGIRFVKFGVTYDYVYSKWSLAQHVLWNAGAHTIEAGYGADRLQTDYIRYFDIDDAFKQFLISRGQAVPIDLTQTVSYNRYNAFVQDRISLGDRLFFQPGLRLDYYPVLGAPLYLAPRLNLSYKIDDLSTLRAAYGIYYQSPGMEKEGFAGRITYTLDSFAGLRAERADHYILGYDHMLSAEWQLKLDSYYKRFTNSIVQQKLAGSQWYTARTGADPVTRAGWSTPVRVPGDSLTSFPVNDATGNAYGFEVLFQKIRTLPSDRFTGWIGYALSFAYRDRNGVQTAFLFDQRHAVNVVGNIRLGEHWDIGAKFILRSGRPYARALGVRPRVVTASVGGRNVPVVQTDPNGKVVLDVDYEQDSYTGRLNLYHSLDVRVTTYPEWWGLHWSLYLDVQNIYNRKNEQQVSFYVDGSGNLGKQSIYGIPIFPSLGMSLSF